MTRSIAKVGRNSAIYMASFFMSSAISYLLLPLYTTYLTPADYGIIALVNIVGTITSNLLKIGQDASIARLYFDYYSQPSKLKLFLGAIIGFLVAVDIIITLIIILSGESFFSLILKDVPFAPYIIIGLITANFNVLVSIAYEYIRILEKAILFVTFQIISLVLTIGLNIYFVVVVKEGALGVLKATLIVSSVSFVLSLVFFLKNSKLNFNKEYINQSVKLGIPFIPHNLAGIGIRMTDTFILNFFVPLNQVGLYAIASRINSIIFVLQDSFNSAWNPPFQRIAVEDGSNAPPFFAKLTTYYFFMLITVMLFFSLFARELIMVATKSPFHSSWVFVPVLATGAFFKGIYLMSTQQLIHAKAMKYMPVSSISAAIINILFSLGLTYKFGVFGAAAATTISEIFLGFIAFYFAQKVYYVPYEKKKILFIFTLYVFLTLFGLFIPIDNFFLDIGFKLLIFISFLLICSMSKYINISGLQLLKGLIIRK